jgi:hypothetical protein
VVKGVPTFKYVLLFFGIMILGLSVWVSYTNWKTLKEDEENPLKKLDDGNLGVGGVMENLGGQLGTSGRIVSEERKGMERLKIGKIGLEDLGVPDYDGDFDDDEEEKTDRGEGIERKETLDL